MTGTIATTNRSNLRYIFESQWGVTPGSGITRECRFTSHSLATKKNTVMSNEIRDDRMVSDIIQTEMMSDGGINYEFSAGAMDDFLQAFVLGTWTRPMTFDSFSGEGISWATDATIQIANQDVHLYFTSGRRIKTMGFVNPVNNGYFQLSSSAYSAPNTILTVTTTSSVAEAGNLTSAVMDANDVIILNDGNIRSGTSSGSTFDSNSNDDFASAITAGQLNPSQIIWVDGLGRETGTVAFAAVCVAASTVTVEDGDGNTYTFVAGTDFAVGSTAANSATNLGLAINKARVFGVGGGAGVSPTYLNVNATVSTDTVTIIDLDLVGGSISKTEPASGTNITVTNFSGGHANESGFFTIVSATDDVLTVTPAPSTNANSGTLPVVIKGSMLRNPSTSAEIVPQSFTIESFYTDVSLGFEQNGLMVNTFSLDANASAVMTGAVEFMGKATSTLTSTALGNTSDYSVLGQTTNEVLNATTDVGVITRDGVALTTAIKQIKIDGKASLRNQMAVGSKFPVGIGTGRFELTGTIQAYFEDLQLYNDFLNHTTVSLSFNFEDLMLNTYYVTLPAIKVDADPINSKGIDQDVMEDITFAAFRDPVTECMIQLDRFSSVIRV